MFRLVRAALVGLVVLAGTAHATPASELAPRGAANLGISGDNLTSHVDLLESSVGRLGLDLVVLCLTNEDLSPWDGQLERRDAGRLSAFSFTRLLLGEGAPWLLARLRSPLVRRQPGCS